ncbi:MAG: GNAT family N-acetyltransferase, partial [Chloroflexi bacterium]|nr:GNAT family N-acetyltransferase [Chloroflexota bacterium]
SPTTHYIDYAKREVELELHEQRLLRTIVPPLLDAFKPLLRWSRFERVVYVNNWLLSTNLYPPLDPATIQEIRDELIRRFPQHVIIFRSVNERLNAPLLHDLIALRFRPVFSRQVYIIDPATEQQLYRKRKSIRRDILLSKRSEYQWLSAEQLGPSDSERLAELYADLYLHKYSFDNPQFNAAFVTAALHDGWLRIWALAHNGRIDGVLGYVERHGVMTTPLLGYDRAVSAKAGLYRLLSLKLLEEAEQHGFVLHLSSGAADFKRHRGGQPAIEYNLVYDRHCARRQRLPWRMLDVLTRRAIVPVMQRFKL